MWFKNLLVYRMTGWNLSPDMLDERLAAHALQKCLSMEMQSRGWVPPKEDSGNFVHALEQQLLISLGTEKKLLPASVINQLTKERAAEIARRQGFDVGRKQLKDIKESVLLELLPQAFVVHQKTNAWIDPEDGWFLIDTPSPARADELLEMLFKSVDTITLKPLKTNISPVVAMTGWLSGNGAPVPFTIDRRCELRARNDEKSTVNYINHHLDTGEILRHVQAGKEVTKLALTWNDKVSFILHENMQLKRITPLDILTEPVEREDDQFDSDFSLMAGELKQLIADIIEALSGEEILR